MKVFFFENEIGEDKMNKEEMEKYLYCAMSIGEKMLMCGAEVGRVEDTITRICYAYGARRVDVFSLTSLIITSVDLGKEGEVLTQSRRVLNASTDFTLLDRLNCLSRKICGEKIPPDKILEELQEICERPGYSFNIQLFIYALISGSFAVFFGGTVKDMLVSAAIGVALKCAEDFLRKERLNPFMSILLCSVVGGFLANLAVHFGIGDHAEMINLGNVMLFIQGVAFTNAMRDMFSRDIISGLTRVVESLLTAIVMAMGFAFSGVFF